MNQLIRRLQQDLVDAGLYEGLVDGMWGPMSQAGWDAAMGCVNNRCDATLHPTVTPTGQSLAWSAKVSQPFCNKVIRIADQLGMPVGGEDWLMACMAWETGERFSSSIRNMAGSGATGLIQFMPATARGLGTTTDELAKMDEIQQLDYVYRYFLPYRGRLNSLADTYMAILWPAGIGKPLDWAMWDANTRPTTYRQNAGLDVNKDGVITKREAASKVQAKLDKGLLPQNRRFA